MRDTHQYQRETGHDNIVGAVRLTEEEILQKIWNGHRLVTFPYCVSILILTFRRSSEMYLLAPVEAAFGTRLWYAIVSLTLGWWGLPWGPIYTIQSLSKILSGGTDHTRQYLQQHAKNIAPPLVTSIPPFFVPPLPIETKQSGLAFASLILALFGMVCMGPIGFIPAIICGHMALRQIHQDNSFTGRSMALAGLIIGYFMGFVYVVVLLVVLFSKSPTEPLP